MVLINDSMVIVNLFIISSLTTRCICIRFVTDIHMYVLFVTHGTVVALRAIKRELIDPFNRLENWVGNDPCGAWTGVICDINGTHVTEL